MDQQQTKPIHALEEQEHDLDTIITSDKRCLYDSNKQTGGLNSQVLLLKQEVDKISDQLAKAIYIIKTFIICVTWFKKVII